MWQSPALGESGHNDGGDSHTRLPGHCEPVTDVTGVAIPRLEERGLNDEGDSHASVRYFLGMTVLLFVLFFFSETAPFSAVRQAKLGLSRDEPGL